MADREKVINIYANCIQNDKQCCSDCYTGGPGLGIACRQQVLTDALYLLKEQEKALYELGQLLKEQAEEIERLKKPNAGDNKIPLKW